jgi:HSP20 family protein
MPRGAGGNRPACLDGIETHIGDRRSETIGEEAEMAHIIVRRNGGEMRPAEREWLPRFFEPMRQLREMLRWDPFAEMMPMGREREMMFAPDFDIKDTPDAIVMQADLPGIDEEDLDVTVTGNRLMVSGKREAEEEQKGETWYACERSYGSFQRTFTLPEGCDAENLRASLEKGVLTLHIPKRAQSQPKKIQIGSGGKASASGTATSQQPQQQKPKA